MQTATKRNDQVQEGQMPELMNEQYYSAIELPDSPLVSVIVCSYNRHSYLNRALESVLDQDTVNFEVIVVDDGSDSPIQLSLFSQTQVRLIRVEHGGVGAARDAGLSSARGTYVAYCDDDDIWKPNHLSTLLNYVTEHPEVDVVYADSEWIKAGQPSSVPYSVDYDVTLLGYSNYIFASDVLHRADAAKEAGGFDRSLQAYEDWDLWLRMSESSKMIHLPIILSLHYWDESCVLAQDDWTEWERVYEKQQQRLLSNNCIHPDIIQTPYPGKSFNYDTWKPENRELIWHSILFQTHSYGQVSRNLLLSLEKEGVKITMAPTKNQPQRGLERFYKSQSKGGKYCFYYDFRLKPRALNCERVIHYSMWESTLIPKDHVNEINKAVTLQYVPCRQNLESFQEAGVNVPINVLHHGVDAKAFPYIERQHSNWFTFGSFSEFSPRKGIDVLIRAFQDEFRPTEPVRLLLKSTKSSPPFQIHDSRVSLISGLMNQDMLLTFLSQMNVFVLPSRGEGFGLTGIEAMSTGLPLIATNWSGPVEYLDPTDSFPLSYKLVEIDKVASNGAYYNGKWAEPDYEHLRFLMRWLFEHPREASLKGKAASDRVHEKWTWEKAAKQICNDLDLIVKSFQK